jgi:hypothetical protein
MLLIINPLIRDLTSLQFIVGYSESRILFVLDQIFSARSFLARLHLVEPIGAGYYKFTSNVTISLAIYSIEKLAQNVTGIIVPNSGQWIPEEQPVFLVKLLNNFFSGNSTASSK